MLRAGRNVYFREHSRARSASLLSPTHQSISCHAMGKRKRKEEEQPEAGGEEEYNVGMSSPLQVNRTHDAE